MVPGGHRRHRQVGRRALIGPGFERYAVSMEKLGKLETGASCLDAKRLEDLDEKVPRRLVARSVADMKTRDPDACGCG